MVKLFPGRLEQHSIPDVGSHMKDMELLTQRAADTASLKLSGNDGDRITVRIREPTVSIHCISSFLFLIHYHNVDFWVVTIFSSS